VRTYYQRDIYLCLAKHGPLKVIEITRRVGLPFREGTNHPTRVGAQAMLKMRRAGLVERIGIKWQVVPGSRAPKDKRGTSAGSLLALRSHARNNMARLQARKGFHVRPVATTALEQAWGWMPTVDLSKVAPANEQCLNTRAKLRPQESEAA
jgi:hypothetical protein